MIDLQGSLVAIVTPMSSSADVDYDALQGLIDWQIGESSDGLVIVGTTGESATLDEREHCEVLHRAIEMVGGRVPVIAGTGANATTEAIRLTACAAEAGADAALLVTPYYNKPTQEGLFRHYRAIAEAVDIPQILYNVPARTCCDLENNTVVRLAELPNIIGLKDATGELDRLTDLRKRVPENFLLYSGDDASACEYLLGGGDGVITVTGNVAPRKMHELSSAARVGNVWKAHDIDEQLRPLHEALFVETSPIPVKWALYRMGLVPAGIRLPLTWMSSEHEQVVLDAMQKAGVS